MPITAVCVSLRQSLQGLVPRGSLPILRGCWSAARLMQAAGLPPDRRQEGAAPPGKRTVKFRFVSVTHRALSPRPGTGLKVLDSRKTERNEVERFDSPQHLFLPDVMSPS